MTEHDKELLAGIDQIIEGSLEFNVCPVTFIALKVEVKALITEKDSAVNMCCHFFRSADKKAGIEPSCSADCPWRVPQTKDQ